MEPPVEPPVEPPAQETPSKSVYLFVAAEGAPGPEWSASGFQTVPAEGEEAKPLFYFSGDSAAGETNGAGQEGWQLYTGPTATVTGP